MIDIYEVTDLNSELKIQAELLLCEFLAEKSENDEQYQSLLESFKEWSYKTRIVGKEKNNVIIFTWQCINCPLAKTFLASYHAESKFSKLLLQQEKALNIVNASLNFNDTLLAFTTVETESSLSQVEKATIQNFNAFIAEIHPQNRVFSLNVGWNTYQKVQFLNEYTHSSSEQNQFTMLFFNHKNSIQIYQLCVDNEMGKVTLSEQPRTQQIAGAFIWAKFDIVNHRLYYLQLLPQDEMEMDASAVLNAIEFKADGTYEYFMSFILPVKMKMELMKRQSFYYIDQYFTTVSCKSFNMDILAGTSGSFYVCFQHPAVESRNTEEESSEDDQSTISESSSYDSILQPSGTNGSLFINYSIICIHGGYTANCSSILPASTSNKNVCFTIFNDYLMVYLPNSFLHLLDISCEHEPVHSLLIRKKEFLPKMPHQCPTEPLLFTPYQTTENTNDRFTTILYETQTETVYKMKLNVAMLYKFFLSSKPQIRTSVLHACVNHFEHEKLTRKILERICQDPGNMDSSQMLKEYLILAPYVEMKRSVTQLDLKVYPLTTQTCYRGQVERNTEGHRDVYLSYKLFKKELITQIRKVLRHCQGMFWQNVVKHMTYEGEYRNKRIPLHLFYLAGVHDEPLVPSATRSGRRNTSFIIVPRNEEDSITGRDSPKDDSVIDEHRKVNENLNKFATECFVSYLTKVFGEEMKIRAENICRDYMELRFCSINALWKIVLNALGHTDEGVRFKNLSWPTNELETAIFQVVGRLKVICDQLCYPKLPNMNDLLCTLSFRCLNRRHFARYLDAQVVSIDKSWIRRAMGELPDNADNTKLIMNLIKRLNKPEAHKLLLEWNNPIGNRYLSEHISWKVPCDAVLFQNTDFEQVNQTGEEEFIPLKTLLHAFKAHGRTSVMFGTSRGDKKQSDFLHETALSNTNDLLEA